MTKKSDSIIQKIEKAGLVGRGGSAFPTHLKWLRIKNLENQTKYLVCNCSEGEPGVKKDYYILRNFPHTVVKGMIIAMDYIGAQVAYFNINQNYYQKIGAKLRLVAQEHEDDKHRFCFFIEEPSYIGGESGTILNSIEGKRVEPRLKPPSPSIKGLYSKPTLIHNVETLYNVSLVADDKYENKRYYTITGHAKNPGVYYLSSDLTTAEVLKQTDNYPDFNFFTQIGGDASGEIINMKQCDTKLVGGCGSIRIYKLNTPTYKFLQELFNFYRKESCGKCTPCRFGTYQLDKLIKKNSNKIPWEEINLIIDTMEKTAFCALGQSLAIPIRSYYKNILNN